MKTPDYFLRAENQKVYLQALQANPKIYIKLGYFSIHRVNMTDADDFELSTKYILDKYF